MRNNLFSRQVLPWVALAFLVFSIPLKAVPWTLESWQGKDQSSFKTAFFVGKFQQENMFFEINKKVLSPEDDPCLTAVNGQYPSTTFSPTCTGVNENITTVGYAGEFSKVNLQAGVTYTFSSSVVTDYITISNEAGSTAYVWGTTPIQYTPSSSGVVRFYTHTNNSCGSQSTSRTRSVKCSAAACTITSVTDYPFTETFELSSPTRSCWINEFVSGTSQWTFRTGAGGGGAITTAHGGTMNASFYIAANNNAKTKLVSPKFDFTGKENASLNFWYGNQDWLGDQNELRVFYKTSAGGAWTMIPGAEYTNSVAAWTEITLNLPDSDNASEYFIAFEGMNDFGRGVVVDDVVVDAEDAATATPCSSVQSGTMANGMGNLRTLLIANDFVVAPSTQMDVDQVSIRNFAKIGNAAVLNFYTDNGGKPGGVVASFTNLAPTSQTFLGVLFGLNTYNTVFNLPSTVSLEGSATGSIYWVGIQVTQGNEGASIYWEYATSVQNALTQVSSDNGGSWTPNGAGVDVAMTVSGQCKAISCFSPNSLTVTGVTSNSATLNWTEPSPAPSGGYDYYYSTSSVTPDDATTPTGNVAAGTSSIALSGLTPLTTYYAWVRSNCGGDTSIWKPAQFSTPPSLPNYDCYQGDGIVTPVENGNNITASGAFRVAANILVDPGFQFTVKELTFEILSATAITNATINIRANNAGSPGAVEHTVTMAPTTSAQHGVAFGFNVYRLTFELATPIVLDEGTYWLEPTMTNTDSSSVFWQQTSSGTHGALTQNSGDSGATWSPNVNGFRSVFFAAGDCDEVTGCLIDFYGQYPAATFVPQCFGAPQTIVTIGWTNEYSKVSLTAGVEYTFSSSIATDFITISDENGTVVNAYGVTPVTYTPTANEVVRFYTHADEDCNDDNFNHARIVQCGAPVVIEEPDFDCFQGDGIVVNLANVDGYNINPAGSFRNADDFIVDAGFEFSIHQITLDVLSQSAVNNATINIRANNAGAPGAVLETVTMAPSSSVAYASLFGYTVYHLTFDLAAPLVFEEGTYWVEPTMTNAGGNSVFWLMDPAGSNGAFVQSSDDSGATWEEDEDEMQAVFFVAGECDEVEEPVDYCIPSSTGTIDYISNFSTTGAILDVSNLNSGLSPSGYGDFYDTKTLGVFAGVGFNFNATYVGGNAGFKIWVDLNKDGVFDASEALFVAPTTAPSFNGTISLPAGTPAGDYRMRIRAHWNNQDVQPCGVINWGEAEDYKVTVYPMDDCSGTPDGGSVTVTPTQGNPDSTYTVTASGFSVGNGLTYQWQSNTDGAGWVNEGAASSSYAAYTATAPSGLGVVVEWRLVVTCTLSTESAESDTATFTTVVTYCVPVSTSTSDYISNFSTTAGVSDISNLNSGLSAGGYGDFYNTMGASVLPETPLNFNATYVGGSAGFRIWVDFNGNGTFEASEMLYSASTAAATHNGSITVPAGTPAGDYRMRIRAQWSNTNVDPCATITWGEAEDYKLTVLSLDDCSGEPDAGTVTVTPAQGAPGSAYTVSATGYSMANGITYQWQSNTDGAGWVNEGAAMTTYADYSATAPMGDGVVVEWKLVVSCTISGGSADSTIDTFTVAAGECYQEFTTTVDPDVGIGFSSGNRVANDVFVQAGTSFEIQTIKLEVVSLSGNPTEFAMEIFEDNGTGGIGATTGDMYSFDNTNMTFVPNGLLFGQYPRFTVTLDVPNALLSGGTAGKTYWLAIDSELSSTAQPTFWIAFPYVTGSTSNPTWQYTPANNWFVYVDSNGGKKESFMRVEGNCEELGVGDLSSFDFSYYPNPVKDVLNISTKKVVKDVSVFNLAGQKVIGNAKVTQGQINVSTLSPGTYVFRVTLEGGQVETFKIIKK